MKEEKLQSLQNTALKVREHVIRMSANGGCFIGASLSCVEIIVYLYNNYLNINADNLKNEGRDYFFLSKGHDVPALYGTLVENGLLGQDRLSNHLSTSDYIYWHPNRFIPTVEFHSGSLGHLPSVALGVALDCKMKKQGNKIIVMIGDGEMNEGTIWEAMLVANAHRLDNMTFIVDRNHFQANKATEDLIPLEPIEDKFKAFGCNTMRINGHDFSALDNAFSEIPFYEGKVNVIIADTVRGKGLPSIEARADRWFCNFSTEEVNGLLNELHGDQTAELESETLVVR